MKPYCIACTKFFFFFPYFSWNSIPMVLQMYQPIAPASALHQVQNQGWPQAIGTLCLWTCRGSRVVLLSPVVWCVQYTIYCTSCLLCTSFKMRGDKFSLSRKEPHNWWMRWASDWGCVNQMQWFDTDTVWFRIWTMDVERWESPALASAVRALCRHFRLRNIPTASTCCSLRGEKTIMFLPNCL